MARIVIATAMFPEVLRRLRNAGHVVEVHDGSPPSAALADADALILPLSVRVGGELLAQAPRLRVVANLGVGVDNIDLAVAAQRGIAVANTPDVLTEATADLGWGLLLSVARRIVEADGDLREEGFPGWTFLPPHLGADVYGATLGVIGFGRIGQAIARRGWGFAMRLLYHTRSRKAEAEEATGARFVALDEILQESDFLVLCVPLTEQTRHLIGSRELSLMKRDAILINIARGPVVDEAALVSALERGVIRGAGLDVFEDEPWVPSELRAMRNVVLTPHIGSATEATRRRMANLACDAVLNVLEGRTPPPNLVLLDGAPRR